MISILSKIRLKLSNLLEHSNQDSTRILITSTVFLCVLFMFHFDLLKRFEFVTYDYRVMLRGTRLADPKIVVIEISDDSIAKIGRWPWDRDWHATLVKILKELGAKKVVFDVIFSEKSDTAKDAVLAMSMKAAGNVYLAEIISDASIKKKAALLTSLPELTQAAAGSGHINLYPDEDGVMRRIPLLMDVRGRRIPQLSLAVALDEWGADINGIQETRGELQLLLKDKSKILIPVDQRHNFIINWLGRWKDTFRHYSYVDVVTAYAALKKGQVPLIGLADFKGKICYVGTTATGLFDIRPTSLEPSYPAVGVNLTVLNNLLERRFIREFNYFDNLAVLICLAFILFWMMKLKSYFKTAMLTISVLLVYVVLASLLFVFFSVWASIIYPLALVLATYFFVTLYNQLSVTIERAKLFKLATRDSLTGLFNIGHFKLLLKAELTTLAMRPNRNLSIVMSDVDFFKHTNDTYGHPMGDAVLREVASIIKNTCRALDVAARYGGEEFVLMLPGANDQEAFKVADKIRETIGRKIFFHEKGDFSKTISLGVTQLSPNEKSVEAALARADKALYEAKESGRNKVVIASNSPGANLCS
ncbi:MAG: hypothetical protein COT00_00575 [Candidatus Omnitrophica bacterium CG07_land_8_20_14_0_80_50_8]|nr:MAG: hypothetical protein COT00_00575 [Candidatus Omnitrophica bacterium CG07_land_8_20_14_0_80_50_8]